jgi:hypothetical protein
MFLHIYICIYMYVYMYIYILGDISPCDFQVRHDLLVIYFLLLLIFFCTCAFLAGLYGTI